MSLNSKIKTYRLSFTVKPVLRCFDIVFQRPYRYFSIALKVTLSLSDRYRIFTNDLLWIEICLNVGFSKIDFTMTTINKKIEINKRLILRDLEQLMKIQGAESLVFSK